MMYQITDDVVLNTADQVMSLNKTAQHKIINFHHLAYTLLTENFDISHIN